MPDTWADDGALFHRLEVTLQVFRKLAVPTVVNAIENVTDPGFYPHTGLPNFHIP